MIISVELEVPGSMADIIISHNRSNYKSKFSIVYGPWIQVPAQFCTGFYPWVPNIGQCIRISHELDMLSPSKRNFGRI